MRYKYLTNGLLSAVILCVILTASTSYGVTSKLKRYGWNGKELKGKTTNVVLSSEGTIKLGRASEPLGETFEDVWSINSIVVDGGTVFLGTSPNGGIYKYSLGRLTKVYSAQSKETEKPEVKIAEPNDPNAPAEPNKPADSNKVESGKQLANEHIFAMATDVAGRLLAGISGENCRLARLETGKMETIFEPNDAKYIFAIVTDMTGNIYLGTGPEGKIYKLDSFGKKPELVYDSVDKNILSMIIGEDGMLYAGSDSRGLVYQIDMVSKKVKVLYDSSLPEITALLFADGGSIYAAATSAQMAKAERKFASKSKSGAGRPDVKSNGKKNGAGKKGNGLKLNIGNTKKTKTAKPFPIPGLSIKPAKPKNGSFIYKITEEGFVTNIFREKVVLFSMAKHEGKVFVGTGNNGQLFSIDPAAEQEAVIYEDEQASQITAVTVAAGAVYIGTANPAKALKLSDKFSTEGTYSSKLIDAGQPARWGKLQIEADIPEQCNVMMACRSGNVDDINDPTFSEWTDLQEVTEPVELRCPVGRFCQYKLVLQSPDGAKSPLVRQVVVAYTIDNLPPKVRSVKVDIVREPKKKGFFNINYKASDENGDKLIYKIEFKKLEWERWIELKDKNEKSNFEWDGKTVEDGRYEVRVTASDERSNTTETKLTGSRISDPVVVDNTGPSVLNSFVEIGDKAVTLRFVALDELSIIGDVDYTVNSNDEWIGTLPDDLVYDTTKESFAIVIDDLEEGKHIISLRVSDAVGNISYKTFEVSK